MKSIAQILSATASSLFLSIGLTRLSEKLDPMCNQLTERSDGLLREADPSSIPTMIATFSAR